MSVQSPFVLILASEPGFAREIKAHWPQEPAPLANGVEFVVLDEGFSGSLEHSHHDLAIADASSMAQGKAKHRPVGKHLRKPLNPELRQALMALGKPAILIHSDPSRELYNIHGPIVELRRETQVWPSIAGLLGREILRRVFSEAAAQNAEKIASAASAEATLGRFMVEMRSNMNNVLTTVLGNAELLMHEPGLPLAAQMQADAIRNMALRLHEILQRFSSIETELSVAARDSGMPKTRAASAGGCA